MVPSISLNTIRGKIQDQITKGDWPLREVLEVDEKNRHNFLTASGRKQV